VTRRPGRGPAPTPVQCTGAWIVQDSNVSPELPPGALIALRYRLATVLGHGGMGTVYRAWHVGLDREIALKIVPPGVGDRAATVRFEREARNAARLDHPGCVRVLDVGTTPDGHRFLAMDLLRGTTLRHRLASGPIATSEAVRTVAAVLDALAHAHDRGVVHRDVKPENIMLTPRPVLIDFGLSWALGDAHVTRRGTTVGSPSYLAPERALGHPGDHRADVYAAGVILYEMLAGRRPFAAASALELAWMHAHREPPFLPDTVPGVPLGLAAAVDRALTKDPERRWAGAAAMRAALDGADLGDDARPLPAAGGGGDDESTVMNLERRSRLRDLLGRLRFGRWRWKSS
jgi:eukaryotic-like serine/threonine-protein kinase